MIDSDPFASNPSRCDGLLPMLLYYDSSNFTNDPENKSNTRLLSHIFRLLYELADSQYDDPGTYDESDYRTWGARRKLCYSLEQIVTGIKVQREFVWAVGSPDRYYAEIFRSHSGMGSNLALVYEQGFLIDGPVGDFDSLPRAQEVEITSTVPVVSVLFYDAQSLLNPGGYYETWPWTGFGKPDYIALVVE